MASTVKCHSLGVFKHDLSLLFLLYINSQALQNENKDLCFLNGKQEN